MSEYTRTPWEQHQDMTDSVIKSSDGRIIADVYGTFVGESEGQANARHIVHCVNNHERLVKALEIMVAITDRLDPYITTPVQVRDILNKLKYKKGGEL